MALIKCNKCGGLFPKEELIYLNKTTKHCVSCRRDAEEFKVLIDNLCKLYNTPSPNGLLLKKIKEYREMGITYAQIWFVMDYLIRVECKQLTDATIFMIPNYFDATRRLYETKERFNKSLDRALKGKKTRMICIDEINIVKPKLEKTRSINIADL